MIKIKKTDDLIKMQLSRGQKYYACYTLVFLLCATLCFASFLMEGKLPLRYFDGLDQQFTVFVYEGKWLRSIVKNLLCRGQLLIPLWDTSIGYGADILTTWGFCFGEPLYLLSAIVPTKLAEFGYCLVVVLRLYLSGLFFSWYSFSRRNGEFGTLLGAVAYAFSGWMLLSCTEGWFVPPAAYLPLLLMGIDRVLENESPVLLVIVTASLFTFYFYFGYMTCILAPLYTLVRILFPVEGTGVRKRRCYIDEGKRFGKAALFFTLGVMLSGVFVLPTLGVIAGEGRLGLERWSPLFYDPSYYLRLLSGFVSVTNVGPDSLIGCGAFCLPCAVLLFRRKGHNRALRTIFVLLVICLMFPILGRVFNGMGYVANRWAFAFALCTSMIVARMATELQSVDAREAKTILLVIAVYGLLLLLFPSMYSADSFICCADSFICLLLSALLCFACVLQGSSAELRMTTRSFRATQTILLVLSLSVPWCYYSIGVMPVEVDSNTAVKRITKTPGYIALNALDDNGLYRYDCNETGRTRNADMLANRNSYNFYMSVYNGNIEQFERSLRLAATSLPQQISGPSGSAFLHTVLGTKYFVCPMGGINSLPFGFSREPVHVIVRDGVEYGVFRNANALPLAHGFEDAVSTTTYESLNPLEKRQTLMQAVVLDGVHDDIKPKFTDVTPNLTIKACSDGVELSDNEFRVKKQGATVEYTFDGISDAETYVEFENIKFQGTPISRPKTNELPDMIAFSREWYPSRENLSFSIRVGASNGMSGAFGGQNYKAHMYGGKDSSVVCLGYSSAPVTSVTLTFDATGDYRYDGLRVRQQPMSELEGYADVLKKDDIEVTEDVNSYQIAVDMDKDKYVYVAIPWSEGWIARVDGSVATVLKADQAFMAVQVPSGKHTIVLEYHTPLFLQGLTMSIVSVLLTIGSTVYYRRRKEVGIACIEQKGGAPDEFAVGK